MNIRKLILIKMIENLIILKMKLYEKLVLKKRDYSKLNNHVFYEFSGISPNQSVFLPI